MRLLIVGRDDVKKQKEGYGQSPKSLRTLPLMASLKKHEQWDESWCNNSSEQCCSNLQNLNDGCSKFHWFWEKKLRPLPPLSHLLQISYLCFHGNNAAASLWSSLHQWQDSSLENSNLARSRSLGTYNQIPEKGYRYKHNCWI